MDREPLTPVPMHLLIAILNATDKLDVILAGFVELGVRGATVIHSEGMGRVLSHDIPIFAGLQTLINRSGPESRTILTVITADLIDPVISLIQESCGDLEKPATGIIFTLPVDRVVGLATQDLGDTLE
jgi:nitrogen regulatory protein P-II 1